LSLACSGAAGPSPGKGPSFHHLAGREGPLLDAVVRRRGEGLLVRPLLGREVPAGTVFCDCRNSAHEHARHERKTNNTGFDAITHWMSTFLDETDRAKRARPMLKDSLPRRVTKKSAVDKRKGEAARFDAAASVNPVLRSFTIREIYAQLVRLDSRGDRWRPLFHVSPGAAAQEHFGEDPDSNFAKEYLRTHPGYQPQYPPGVP
jgi:hypothetical protein